MSGVIFTSVKMKRATQWHVTTPCTPTGMATSLRQPDTSSAVSACALTSLLHLAVAWYHHTRVCASAPRSPHATQLVLLSMPASQPPSSPATLPPPLFTATSAPYPPPTISNLLSSSVLLLHHTSSHLYLHLSPISVTSLAVTQVPPTSIPASGVLTAASCCSARCQSRYVTQAIERKAWFTPIIRRILLPRWPWLSVRYQARISHQKAGAASFAAARVSPHGGGETRANLAEE